MAASQNLRSGSTPKTYRRSRPPIQTCDPDRSRPHDPDRSRPHDPDRSRPMIATPLDRDPFVLCWLDIFFYKVLKSTTLYYKVLLQYYSVLQSTEKYYSVLQRTSPVLLCTTKYYPVLQSTILGDFVPRSKPRSRPVPDQFHGIQGQCPFTAMLPKKTNRFVRPVQNHLIQFKSYMKWLS